MEIAFRTNKLQKAAEKAAEAARLWGVEVARKYIQRIRVIYAMPEFEKLKEFPALKTHELKGNRKGEWAIALTGQWRLIVVPSNDGMSLQVKEVSNHYGD